MDPSKNHTVLVPLLPPSRTPLTRSTWPSTWSSSTLSRGNPFGDLDPPNGRLERIFHIVPMLGARLVKLASQSPG